MRKLLFEELSQSTNEKINTKIEKLNDLRRKGMITQKEKEYMFLYFLQRFCSLSEKEVFQVYTNSDI